MAEYTLTYGNERGPHATGTFIVDLTDAQAERILATRARNPHAIIEMPFVRLPWGDVWSHGTIRAGRIIELVRVS